MRRRIEQQFEIIFKYPVFFDQGIFKPDNDLVASVLADVAKCYVVLDDGLVRHHPELAAQILHYGQGQMACVDIVCDPVVVPGGEQVKNESRWVDQILSDTEVYGIDRHSAIVAVGGGAVLDMVGYAASIAHRGVKHVRIPTTVLSQNDSGVGVKNGINAFGKKNFIGNFAPPYAVINDSLFLETLDDRDWVAGISEAIKVALIKDLTFFEDIEAMVPDLVERKLKAMEDLIFRCAQHHLQHIASGDPFEMGSSRPLDFGHWSAHKLEQLTDYELRHGEAVAVGMAIDVAYSHLNGHLKRGEMERVLALLQRLSLPIYHSALEHGGPEGQWTILDGLEEFRQHLGGQLTIMLLSELGRGVEVHEMRPALIGQSIDLVKSLSMEPTAR